MKAVTSFTATRSASTPVRLHPREHGAYAILGMPLVTALLIDGLTSVGLLTSVSAIAGFLAHEPLLIVCGCRGHRTRSAVPVAWRALIALTSLAAFCGGCALWQGTASVRVALVACGLLAAVGFGFSATGRQRSLTAQIIGIIGLMLVCLRVLIPGRDWKDGLLRFSFWSLNIGLMAMCVLSLLPVGLLQTRASVEHSYWYARSSEFMQTDLMQTLRWLRVPGDTIFFVGAVALVIFVAGLKTGHSFRRHQ